MSDFAYGKLWIKIAHITFLIFILLFSFLWLYDQRVRSSASFVLTDQNGNIYNSEIDDSYKLIFFGFTNCADICPFGLSKMRDVLETLGADRENIRPIYITVDPQRDTPEVMNNYIRNFGPRLIGLTGEPEVLEAIRIQYAAYARKITPPGYEDYIMDHSGHIYLASKGDIVLEVFDYRIETDKMAANIRERLN